MHRFYQMAQAADRRFPRGVEPYQMATRLLEECGEVANEIRQAMTELAKIAQYYGVEAELEASIAASLARSRAEGLLPAEDAVQAPVCE